MRSTTSSTTPTSARTFRKQLIQHLVTSNPSPAYVARVIAVCRSTAAAGSSRRPESSRPRHPARPGGTRRRQDRCRAMAACGIRRSSSSISLRAFNARSADRHGRRATAYLNPPGGQHGDGHVPTAVGLQLLLAVQRRARQRRRARSGVRAALRPRRRSRRANFINTMVLHAASTSAPTRRTARRSTSRRCRRSPATRRALVDSLNVLLLHGTMSSAMREQHRRRRRPRWPPPTR